MGARELHSLQITARGIVLPSSTSPPKLFSLWLVTLFLFLAKLEYVPFACKNIKNAYGKQVWSKRDYNKILYCKGVVIWATPSATVMFHAGSAPVRCTVNSIPRAVPLACYMVFLSGIKMAVPLDPFYRPLALIIIILLSFWLHFFNRSRVMNLLLLIHFLLWMKLYSLPNNPSFMASFDVASLFTSIPLDEVVYCVSLLYFKARHMNNDFENVTLWRSCIENMFFWNWVVYQLRYTSLIFHPVFYKIL